MMKSAAGTKVAYGFGRMGEWGWSRSAWWYLFVWDRIWLVNCMGEGKGEREAEGGDKNGRGGKKDEQIIPNHPR